MRHWLFLSYARKNSVATDKKDLFTRFVKDLAHSLDQHGAWDGDERPLFFDRESLQLMADWDDDLVRAVQTCCVFACMVSPAYILSEFCAKEFWLFDSRRREAAGKGSPARVLLPIIWVPADPLPPAIAAAQFNHASLPGDYTTLGLRRLMRQGRWRAYRECIDVFAEEILKAGRTFIPPKTLPLPSFGEMPLAFEPAGSRARFVFMAAKRSEFAATARADRYSDNGNAWMPFNPPVPNTVQDISSTAAYEQNMAYGELPADHSLSNTLQNARARDRVVLVVDPWTLCLDAYRSRIPSRDVLDSRRAAVIVPFPDAGNASAAERASVERALDAAFPRVGANANPPYEQTDSIQSFRSAIARGLAATHLNAINAAAEQQASTDSLPTLSSAAVKPNA